jgi:hypothetical protein
MPLSQTHKNKISKGVKSYHACAKAKGCGKKKPVAKKVAKKPVAKKKMDTPALRRAIAKEQARKKPFTIPKKKVKKKKQPRKKGFAKRRTKKEMEEARRMMMEDKNVNKIPVKKPAKKPVKKKAKTPFKKAMEFLWMKHLLDGLIDNEIYGWVDEYGTKKDKENWEEGDSTFNDFSRKRRNLIINKVKKPKMKKLKDEYDKLIREGKTDTQIRKKLQMKFLGEELDDEEVDVYMSWV